MATTEATGIFQSDILIRHALLAGFRDLRANQWLLDYVCAGLRQDELTNRTYGQKEIDALKKWFNSTEIPVIVYGSLVDVKSPAVTIALVSSTEDENTLGDIHYTPQEDVADAPWPALSEPFSARFDPLTGRVTVPVAITTDIFPGMVIVDAAGVAHEILDVEDERVFTIADRAVVDFRGAVLKAGSPSTLQTLESAVFREQYQIGCHVSGEPLQLIFLHTLVVFVLLRGRQVLLEARGFEKSNFSSSDFSKNEFFQVENAWTRYIALNGIVRQAWPKFRFEKLTGIKTAIKVIGAGHLPPESRPPSTQLWMGDLDDENDSVG